MAGQRIHIERLRIRLPRTAAATAPAARERADRLGREILRGIAGTLRGQTGALRIDEVNAKVVSGKAAARIAGDVRKQWDGKGRA